MSSVRVPVTPCVTTTTTNLSSEMWRSITRNLVDAMVDIVCMQGAGTDTGIPASHRRIVTQKLKHFRLPPASSRAASSECVSCHSSWCSIELSTGLREILQCPENALEVSDLVIYRPNPRRRPSSLHLLIKTNEDNIKTASSKHTSITARSRTTTLGAGLRATLPTHPSCVTHFDYMNMQFCVLYCPFHRYHLFI